MTKEFVSYTQALALKELGFDEPCFGYYHNLGSQQLVLSLRDLREDNNDSIEYYIAPTFSQAFRWFREKYGLQHTLWSGKISTIFYGYDVLNIEEQEFVINNSENGGGDCDYDTYEEAELACLRKLIEIVKQTK